jgi:RNA polymerase sigma-70 factor (ECF subfamily)
MATSGDIQALVQAAQGGDPAAFEELVEEYRSRLEGLIGSRLGSHLRANVELEDVLQDTLLRAYRSIGTFTWTKDDSFFLWLSGIAEHVIRSVAQRQQKKGGHILLKRDPTASDVSAATAMRRDERFERLRQSLTSLSDDHRQVIELARIEGLRIKDIAKRMERSPDAVKKLLARALRQLKAQFGDTESLHLPERRLRRDK